MSDKKKIVVVVKSGHSNEMGPLGLTIACGSLSEGLDASLFLVSDAVDMVRKSSLNAVQLSPMETHKDLLASFMERGGKVYACTMCAKLRNYTADDLIEGVVISGASVVLKEVKEGAALWNF